VTPHLPNDLEVDTFDGSAWLSLVIFRLRVRPRWLPFLPGVSSLTEVNLRTYVRYADRPGINFLSVHANNRLAMFVARLLTPMPYHSAHLRYQRSAPHFQFEGSSDSPSPCRLSLTFQPIGEQSELADRSLDAWLLERYRLFLAGTRGQLLEAEVTHPRWSVHRVDLLDYQGSWDGAALSRPPDLVHFAPGVHARFGSFGGFAKVRFPSTPR
jgi:uncharacterized protein YqjF (DUF2071 family)